MNDIASLFLFLFVIFCSSSCPCCLLFLSPLSEYKYWAYVCGAIKQRPFIEINEEDFLKEVWRAMFTWSHWLPHFLRCRRSCSISTPRSFSTVSYGGTLNLSHAVSHLPTQSCLPFSCIVLIWAWELIL